MTREQYKEAGEILELIDGYEKTIRNISIPDTCRATLYIEGTDDDNNNVERSVDIPSDCEKDIVRLLRAKYNELLREAEDKLASI